MRADFSKLNFEYMIQAHELSAEDASMAAVLLGVHPSVTELLAALDVEALSYVMDVVLPITALRGDDKWWEIYLRALVNGNKDEILMLNEQAGMAIIDKDT